MEDKNKQHKIIINNLVDTGVFAVSDIKKGSTLSREGIGKILRKLVEDEILRKTVNKGANVKYKLVVNNKALEFLFEYVEQMTIDDFACVWNVSVGSAKKYVKRFVDDGTLGKFGSPPKKIIYSYNFQKDKNIFSPEQKEAIEKYYVYTTPEGRLLKGIKGFEYWAKNRSGRSDIKKLAEEYISIRKKYYNNQIGVLMIDATEKLHHIFGDNVYIEKLFHQDFDALPVFGKTALSQIVRTAKSGHTNKVLMKVIVDKIQKSIDKIVQQYKIDCVAFIPPTVARKTQLMTFIAQQLRTSCDKIAFSKEKTLVPIQQKSLKKVEDRILNAKKTIVVSSKKQYKNILLIDDVTGSGSTLNETAKKIVSQNIAQRVYALTITGSAKAGVFDIISEA
ncbi:MAG: hypothetical protein KAI57_00485 [Candidatus Pacebacteria bacterium]|nr:hypothetical protein [Candidatus Paceibacterota bacterium]